MEFHIVCDPNDIARYVFCPGDQKRAKKIADHFSAPRLVTDSRGYAVYTGEYDGVPMTVCGTGMGGPTVAIAVEELAHMGADTFIRVGSCGVVQAGQGPGDLIIPSATVRHGGTANAYLPLAFPAVPTFELVRALVTSAEAMGLPVTVGVGAAGDAFYAPGHPGSDEWLEKAGVVALEMESDTLFVVGAYRGWRTGAIFASDGAPHEIKPDWGEAAFREGEAAAIEIALRAMSDVAKSDEAHAAAST